MTTQHKTPQQLRDTLNSWDKAKLVDYAFNLTQAMIHEQAKVKTLAVDYQHSQQQANRLKLVEKVARELSSTLDLNKILTRLLKQVNDELSVQDGSILLVEPLTGDLVFQISLGSISKQIKPFRVPRGQGIAGEVALSGEPIRLDNVQQDSRHFKQIDHDTGFLTRSVLCVPLKTTYNIIGVVEVFNKRTGAFTADDESLLSSIANFAAIAIENARLHRSVIEERDRVITVQDEVSRKIQRDLHDGPTQLVASLQMSIDFCRLAFSKDITMVRKELDEMYSLAEKTTHQMRTLLFELRPLILETQGLVPALDTFLGRHQEESPRTHLSLEIEADNEEQLIVRLVPKAEAALFAIVQESVNNALKYAKANNITVSLTQQGDSLTIKVQDDGGGFDVSQVTGNYEGRGSYGMVNMKERAEIAGGKLILQSTINEGTTIQVDIVLTPELLLEGQRP